MALDAVRNWTVSMEESLQALRKKRRQSNTQQTFDTAFVPSIPSSQPMSSSHEPSKEPVHLPTEIILQILSYLPQTQATQSTLYSCCLLSRQWYSCAIGRLYERPHIYGKNFDSFVRTICPSINMHVRKSALAELVGTLDLGGLVHHGSKSVTARLLGRTKTNLESFVAPQASFAINCFAALSKCTQLKMLDLSLISESISLHSLAHALRALPQLHTFHFPRSSHHDDGFRSELMRWPHKLENLVLAGGIGDRFILGMAHEPANLPPALTLLSIQHCPHVSHVAFRQLLKCLSHQLRNLQIHHMPAFSSNSMDKVLQLCPNLEGLSVSADYITEKFISLANLATETPHPLKQLIITNSGHPNTDDNSLWPIDIDIALDEGFLPNLRVVRVASTLGWIAGELAGESLALNDDLKSTASKAGQDERQCGVFIFDG